jgi:hypothetical protein
MRLFRRKPRIDEFNYGRLMTSFGRTVDRDPLLSGPASALADRIASEFPQLTTEIDSVEYGGATAYHLRLLAGAWLMAAEGSVPAATAEVFEEAVAWKFEPLAHGAATLPRRLSALARGEFERDMNQD